MDRVAHPSATRPVTLEPLALAHCPCARATWILDGLEVTLAGSLGGILTHREALGLTDAQVGASATLYLAGAVCGALLFGYGTDRLGRKKLFFITVGVYLVGTALTAFSWNFVELCILSCFDWRRNRRRIRGHQFRDRRIDTGPRPRPRRSHDQWILLGRSCAWFNGNIVLLDPHRLPVWLGWRCAFGIGAILGLIVIFFRRWIPESPRWLMIHGRQHEAEQVLSDVEQVSSAKHCRRCDTPATRIRTRTHTPWAEIWDAIVHEHRRRSVLGFVLMLTQAFFYNAIFFTYGLVLMRFYNVPANNVGGYLLPFALGNVLGPLLLGYLFDTIGRKPMITATYIISGVLLAITGWLFYAGVLTAQTQTLAWSVVFFVASAAASSAYLTVSEIFPLEIRALAIAIFYAIGTLAGGVGAPLLFGWIIGTGSSAALFTGYLVAAALMLVGGIFAAWLGVAAERRPLEHIAAPLSSR